MRRTGSSAVAELVIHENHLSFKTVNKKRPAVHPSTGIGLVNLRKRLNNIYPGQYELVIRENDEDYFAELIIQL